MIKVGDIVYYYKDDPRAYCIVKKITFKKVWGNWHKNLELLFKDEKINTNWGGLSYMNKKDIAKLKLNSKIII